MDALGLATSTTYNCSSPTAMDNQMGEPPVFTPSAPPVPPQYVSRPISVDATTNCGPVDSKFKSTPSIKSSMGFDSDSRGPRPWSTGLCDSCLDVHTCCLTCWCPCITFGRIAEVVDRGSTSCGVSGALYSLIMCVTGCSCMYSCFYRTKLRGQYFLNESPCTDCCVHCCCEHCALCQEYRELKNHGFDMSIGWHGNMERQKRSAAEAPWVQGGMSR